MYTSLFLFLSISFLFYFFLLLQVRYNLYVTLELLLTKVTMFTNIKNVKTVGT